MGSSLARMGPVPRWPRTPHGLWENLGQNCVLIGAGDDDCPELPSTLPRMSTALRRATGSGRSASRRSPLRGSASVSAASAARAVRTKSSASTLPFSRRSLCGVRLIWARLAASAEVAGEASAIAAGAIDRPGAGTVSRAGGQAPDQASSGGQTGAAVPPGQIIPGARPVTRRVTSSTETSTWRRPQSTGTDVAGRRLHRGTGPRSSPSIPRRPPG
jgi:hypothetical protein